MNLQSYAVYENNGYYLKHVILCCDVINQSTSDIASQPYALNSNLWHNVSPSADEP